MKNSMPPANRSAKGSESDDAHRATARASGPARAQAAAPHDLRGRDLLHKHLGRMLENLFAEVTGVHFHIAWTPTEPAGWDTDNSPTGCAVCGRLTGVVKSPACEACGPRQLARVLASGDGGIQFRCRLGVQNCWVPVRLRGETLGIAYLQARHTARGARPSRLQAVNGASGRRWLERGRCLSSRAFDRAARLLRFVVHSVEDSSLAELRAEGLAQAAQAVVALEQELAHLHDALDRHVPAPPRMVRRPVNETHARQLVERLREIVAARFALPLTLRECARELGMNAAYLSAIFSREVGVSFKAHLTATRLERAKALLSDPTRATAEVAYAVGYASENRFRAAFKQATGLPPKLWRETVELMPPPAGGTPG